MLLSDFAWAFAIVLVTMFLREAQRPLLLSFIQYLVVGVLGIVSGLVFENVYLHEIGKTLPFLLYAGLVSGAIAYTLQVVAQAHIPPSEAAVIMSLESVVAAICGYFALGETLTVLQLVGCLVILISVVFVEVGPTLFKTRYPTSD